MVTDSPIYARWDSSLLGDTVRIMDRMMKNVRHQYLSHDWERMDF